MQMCSIASGSSGNCIYVGSASAKLLVDCGISGRRIENGLKECGVSPADLDGILITHEHVDHISGLGVMARRYKKPVYATAKTIEAVKEARFLGDISGIELIPVQAGQKFTIKDMEICPVHIRHDAADPVGYRLDADGQSVGILTDFGTFDQNIVEGMQGLSILLIEANHDVHMLQAGKYPYYLKKRILGEKGHSSNEQTGRLLNELLSEKMQYVILGHLSKENNYPELAYETVRLEVDMADTPYQASDFNMFVAKRDDVSELIQI